jgi:hypothetical protein
VVKRPLTVLQAHYIAFWWWNRGKTHFAPIK